MEIYTIGFTQKTAKQFFEILKRNNIRQLIDIRLNNTSQIAGFAKKTDLEYFLSQICGIEYRHLQELAPTQDILDEYKQKKISWSEYEAKFNALLSKRKPEQTVLPDMFKQRSVLLCSEPKADKCHRRIVAEYLQGHWPDIIITHI